MSTSVLAPLTSIALQALAPYVIQSCVLSPPAPPPGPTDGPFLPLPEGYDPNDLPVLTPETNLINTAPDQIIGCANELEEGAEQTLLNGLFPSAVSGDGIVDRTSGDFWKYNGTIWENVGTSPGPTLVTNGVIPLEQPAIEYDILLHLRLNSESLPYGLELLAEPDPIGTTTNLLVRSAPAFIRIPDTDFSFTVHVPLVAGGASTAVPLSTSVLAVQTPAVSSGGSALVPAATTYILDTYPIPYIGSGATVIQVPIYGTGLAASTPAVSTGVNVTVGVTDIATAAGAPLINPVFDPDFTNVSLLLHLDGSNGSTTFTDSSSNALTVSASGGTTISTTQSKFGGASAVFAGSSSQYLSADNALLNLGSQSNSWTVENWVYVASSSGTQPVWSNAGVALNTPRDTWRCQCQFSGSLFRFIVVASNSANATEFLTATSYTYSINTWYHVAASYDATTLRLFVNGTLIQSNNGFNQGLTLNPPNTFFVGASPLYSSPIYLTGYIDDFRLTNGVARYTSTFTAPTAPYPDL